jgi:hypothetical protein
MFQHDKSIQFSKGDSWVAKISMERVGRTKRRRRNKALRDQFRRTLPNGFKLGDLSVKMYKMPRRNIRRP